MRSRREPATVQMNLTPMIDVSFQLILFFVLVSHVAEVENVDLDLPRPRDPASELPGDQPHVVISVIQGAAGSAAGYRLGGRVYAADSAGLAAMSASLAETWREKPSVAVSLRADRTTHYRWIEPVFTAVAAAARLCGRDDVNGRINLALVRGEQP